MSAEGSLLLRACAYCNAPATGWTRNSEGHPWPCCDDHAAGTYVEPIVVEPDVERDRLVALLRDLRAQVDHPDGPWVSVNRENLRETLDLLDAGVTP